MDEYKTDSFIKMLKVNSKHKANKKSKGKYEQSKGKYEKFKGESDEDDSQDIFNQNFDIYALDYLYEEKIGQLLENIQKVCRRY